MKKNKILLVMLYIILLSILTFYSISNVEKTSSSQEFLNYIQGLPINYAHAIYAYDTSTPEKTAQNSKYIFIAKINEVVRTEYLNPIEIEDENDGTKEIIYDPFTVYSINVIKNIKGELDTSKSIELMQYGGLNYDGKSYVFCDGGSLLNIGEYYLILTGAMNDGNLEVSNPDRIVALEKFEENFKSSRSAVNNIINIYEEASKINIERNENEKIPILDNVSKYDVNY